MREPDNELAYVEDYRCDKLSTLRIRIVRALNDYKKLNIVKRRQDVDQAEEIRKAECLKLIISDKDDKAKKSYPSEYKALKGEPLDPIKSAAVAELIEQLKDVRKDIEWRRLSVSSKKTLDRLNEMEKDLWMKIFQLRGLKRDESNYWAI
jgi:hypothetical protein